MSNLFLCSIGPVQEFIATARRSRDLWYGSWMLSELSKAAARALQEMPGTLLIFPASLDDADLLPGSTLSVANKILAILDRPPREAAKTVHEKVVARLHQLRDAAFTPIKSPHFKRDLAIRQIDDLLEFYWVMMPYNPADYVGCRNRAEALLAARKSTRDFRQFMGKMVPKSSLDASRESVIDELAYPNGRQDSLLTQKEKTARLYRQFGAKRGERLSGVDLLKRLGSGKPFPSTSAISAAPFLDGLGDESARLIQTLTAYMQTQWSVDVRGDGEELLFPARIREYLLDEDARKAQQDIERILDDLHGKRRPNPYYSILAADGDGMGETLDRLSDEKANREFSQALSTFSEDARRIIEVHNGTPIYLGGDDILTYLPLHMALRCLQELQIAFGRALRSFNPQASLSGGLVIAHHLQPLSEVLILARKAEKEAKGLPGKRALCIVLNKRSGAERRITHYWEPLLQRLGDMATLHQQKAISKGTAYELQDLHRRLDGAGLPALALRKEALRIFKRKKESGGDRELEPKVLEQLAGWLKVVSGSELALEMIVAEIIAATQGLAEPIK